MLWASSWSRWSMLGARSAENSCAGTRSARAGLLSPPAVELSLRRCISATLRLEAKILQLQCKGEEKIFSLRARNDTYIENNSSQPRMWGKRVSYAVLARVPRSQGRSGGPHRCG